MGEGGMRRVDEEEEEEEEEVRVGESRYRSWRERRGENGDGGGREEDVEERDRATHLYVRVAHKLTLIFLRLIRTARVISGSISMRFFAFRFFPPAPAFFRPTPPPPPRPPFALALDPPVEAEAEEGREGVAKDAFVFALARLVELVGGGGGAMDPAGGA